MKRYLLATMTLFSLGTSLAMAQGDENPAIITKVEYWISRLVATGYTNSVVFDPTTEVAREGDYIRVRVTFEDPDIDEVTDNQDVEYFQRKLSWGITAGRGISFSGFGGGSGFLVGVNQATVVFYSFETSPAAPPIENERSDFLGPGGLALFVGSGMGTYEYYYEIPELNGPAQARLRDPDAYDYDVIYWTQLELSETESPGEDDFVSSAWYAMKVIENPVLRPENPPPFSDAGRDQIVNLNEDTGTVTVTLDGTRTFDAYNLGFDNEDENVFDKDTLQYNWEWLSGPERVTPTPVADEPGTAQVTLGLPTPDGLPYVFRLLVTDGANARPTSDIVRVFVRSGAPVNNAPIAVIQGPTDTVAVGQEIELSATDSFDPDSDTLDYRWQQTNEVGGELSPAQIRTGFQPLSGLNESTSRWRATAAGTFYFRLYLVDNPAERDVALVGEELSDTATIAVVVSATTAGTDSQSTRNVGDDANAPVFLDDSLSTTAPCGAGILPLAMLPLMLWPLRGRRP